MKEWKDDKALFALIKEELSPQWSVILWIRWAIPASFCLPASARFVRYAGGRTCHDGLEADVLDAGKEKGVNPVLKRSFGLMLEALDDLKEDEVYVCSVLPLLMPCGAS